jgi:hypothetical protein
MWCEADDHGRGIADARLLKGAIWPLDDDITFLHVSAFIDVLAATGHIRLYAVDGETYYEVTNWEKHQAAAYRRGDAKFPPFSAGQPLESLAAHENVQESAAGTQMGAGTGNREQGTGRRDSTATPPEHAAGETTEAEPLFDDTAATVEGEVVDDEERSTSTEVDTTKPVTAQTILKWLIDSCRAADIDLPKRLIGQYSKEIKNLLDEGQPPQRITAALRLMAEDNILNRPSLLPNKVMTVQTGPEKAPRRETRSTTDDRVSDWLDLDMGVAA